MTVLALWLAAALIAYTIKGFSGFGPALVVVPVLAVLYSPRTALGTSAIIDLAVGAGLLLYLGMDRAHLKLLARMSGALAVGTVTGALLVAVMPSDALLGLVGVFVLVLAVRLLITGRSPGAAPKWAMPLQLSCLLAGISGGLVGVSGPFIVAGTTRFDKNEMRRVLVAVFLVEGVVKTIVYAATGVIGEQSLQLAAQAVPAVIAGLSIGIWAQRRVSQDRFLAVIGWLLVAVSLQPIASAFT